jgi:hypothetical protein
MTALGRGVWKWSRHALPGSKLANLVRLTAGDAHRTDANVLTEPNQVRFLNLVREFRAAARVGISADVSRDQLLTPSCYSPCCLRFPGVRHRL